MSFKRAFFNQTGSIMIQALVAGAALLGAAVYVTKTMKSQESLNKTTQLRGATSQQADEISSILTDWEICKATFDQLGTLSDEALLTKVLKKDSSVVFQNGADLKAGKIIEMRLVDYTAGPGLRYEPANLRVTMQFNEKRAGTQDSFGGQSKSYKIPIYFIALDNKVQLCMSDTAQVINLALMQTCSEFKGTFNPSKGTCENIHGPTGSVKQYISDYFCSETGVGCKHPYAGQVCPTKHPKEATAWNNFAVQGFDASGEMQCVCMKRTCPNPAAYCLGRDLGTDWCGTTCPKGTWDPQDWSGAFGSYYTNQLVPETASCGKSRMINYGTKPLP